MDTPCLRPHARAASPGHRLVDKDRVTLDEIDDDPFILSNEGFDYDVSQIIKGSGITPRLSFSTMENRGIIAMIQHGLGVTVMPGNGVGQS